MQAKNSIIPLHSFFKAPTQKQLALLEQNSPILESFIQTKHPHSHPPLSLLTDLSIAIQEFSGSEYRTTMIREFSRDLKFQKIARKADL